MSVSAVVLRSPDFPAGGAPGHVPVATGSDFTRYWLPLADAAGLTLVRGFEPGVALKRQDLPTALAQLATLRSLVENSAFPLPVEQHLLSRIDTLRQLLTDADDDAVEEVFIG